MVSYKDAPRISEEMGILGIPLSVFGSHICEEAVAYDLPELFDYWFPLVKIGYSWSGDELLKNAGKLKSTKISFLGRKDIQVYILSAIN